VNLKDFQQHLTQKGNYETLYQDTEGRSVLVICELDALAMVNDLVRAEREACAKVCEAYIAEGIGREMAAAIRARGEK